MFKRLAALAAATLVCAVMASTAEARHNTGWPCTPPAIVNAGGGYAYICSSVTWTWWLIP